MKTCVKLTLVSFSFGSKRYSFFVNARYVDGQATISSEAYSELIVKAGLRGVRIGFGS